MPLSRHGSVFMAGMAYPLRESLKNIHFCIKTLVEIEDFFFFLKEIISSSFQAKERKDIVCDLESRAKDEVLALTWEQLTLSKSVLLSEPQFTSEPFLQGEALWF